MQPSPKALLISCYELGHQPLGIASPLAFLRRAGLDPSSIDLAIEPLDEAKVRSADVVAISVPMHTALRLGLVAAKRVRELNPGCRLGFFGHYATLNAELLRDAGADAVFSGESDEALASWIISGMAGTSDTSQRRASMLAPPPFLDKIGYLVPERSSLPELERYVHVERADGTHAVVGSVEASRGCRHLCRHCPLPPVYDGRFFVVAKETVLADVRQLVEGGARHINFVDPDFLNGPKHALEIVRAVHQEHPTLTFDFTAKVEHLLKRRDDLGELAASGCTFVVSAVESLSERVLEELDKGHSARDAREVLSLTRAAGIALRPTFVAFTPWTSVEDYRDLFRWLVEDDLVDNVDPIQLTLRLLIPPGALLLENAGLKPYLGALDPGALTYEWIHPDPTMDELQREASIIVQSGASAGTSDIDIVRSLAGLVELDVPERVGQVKSRKTPRLTEAWFC